MTTNELNEIFNGEFGLSKRPRTFEVDYETYANVCQSIFSHLAQLQQTYSIKLSLGTNCGIIFKGVELILKNY